MLVDFYSVGRAMGQHAWSVLSRQVKILHQTRAIFNVSFRTDRFQRFLGTGAVSENTNTSNSWSKKLEDLTTVLIFDSVSMSMPMSMSSSDLEEKIKKKNTCGCLVGLLSTRVSTHQSIGTMLLRHAVSWLSPNFSPTKQATSAIAHDASFVNKKPCWKRLFQRSRWDTFARCVQSRVFRHEDDIRCGFLPAFPLFGILGPSTPARPEVTRTARST